MIGHRLAVAQHPDPVQAGDDLDPAADHRRVDGVVVGVQPDVVVAGQPGRGPPPGRRGDRRQRQHRRLVGGDPVGRGAAQRPPRPGVDQRQPVLQLGVEVRRAGERPAGQERAFQVVMGPLDQPLGLRVGGLADHHLGPQRAAERLALGGQLGPARPATGRSRPPRPTPAPAAPPPARRSAATSPRTGPPRCRDGISTASSHRAYPVIIVSTGSCAGLRTCPQPTGTVTGGNQKSHWAISPAT